MECGLAVDQRNGEVSEGGKECGCGSGKKYQVKHGRDIPLLGSEHGAFFLVLWKNKTN